MLPRALMPSARLLRDLFVDRDRPDLGRLAAIEDPHAFVWSILPHAARTFSAAIGLLPRRLAEASAVAYLYCRMLDTYEDLVACPRERDRALEIFTERLTTGAPAPTLRTERPRDLRDQAHLLLVQRCHHVDAAFVSLPPEVQALVRTLVRRMAEGMRWSSATFERQGGVLESDAQIEQYCRNVLGEPVLFSGRLLRWHHARESSLSPTAEADAVAVGEMIQLANVTRDIEKDLARGVAYDPSLRADLDGRPADGGGREERIRRARLALMRKALGHAPAYRRLVDHLDLRRVNLPRASAVLMLLFTDRYYRGCATRAHHPTWGRRHSSVRLLLTALPAALSRRWTRRVLRRIEADFLAARLEA